MRDQIETSQGVERRVRPAFSLLLAAAWMLLAGCAAPGSSAADTSTAVSHNDDWSPAIEEYDGVAMALVPAGCFTMGSLDSINEQPVHEVCFDQPYWIDVTEVTNAQFEAFGGQAARASSSTQGARPRDWITWGEAADFCALRGGRLPTEAEWEYAARGPDGWIYPWGNEFVGTHAVWDSTGSAPVGSRPEGASWVGALDMSGNLWEWVGDWYGEYAPEAQVDPQGPAQGALRILRGGSWANFDPQVLRAANRDENYASGADALNGFRCARSFENPAS